jgi:CRISPR-associated endonuclease/helicase Cas3
MLTDMSSAASLVQRFGRCNRFAESKSAEITVVYKTLEIAKFGQGKDLAFIVSLNGDASCANLYSKRSELAALAKVKPCPTLDPALLDILSMTSLKHDIDISNYLRGKDTSVRYCDIAWREEVPLLTKLNKYDFESYMRAMPVLGFETVSDTPKRVKEVLEVVSTTAECIVIMPEGERVVRTVAGLQDMPLRDSLILLPPHVGGLAGGMFSDHNRDAVALDIATIEHKNHPARQRILVAVDAVPMLPKNEKEVFNRTVKGMTLIVRKPKVVQSGKAVLLSLHHSAVAGTANDFATRCGLDAEIVAALTKAGEMHDVGKMNPIWQIAACGKMNNPPLAKSGGVFKNPTALDGLRHEFESLAAVAHGNQICQHVIASHHAGGRPCWAGTKNLSPVNRDGDAVLAQINRFAQLQAQLGWWGLAYVEAVFRCADAYASEEGE